MLAIEAGGIHPGVSLRRQAGALWERRKSMFDPVHLCSLTPGSAAAPAAGGNQESGGQPAPPGVSECVRLPGFPTRGSPAALCSYRAAYGSANTPTVLGWPNTRRMYLRGCRQADWYQTSEARSHFRGGYLVRRGRQRIPGEIPVPLPVPGKTPLPGLGLAIRARVLDIAPGTRRLAWGGCSSPSKACQRILRRMLLWVPWIPKVRRAYPGIPGVTAGSASIMISWKPL